MYWSIIFHLLLTAGLIFEICIPFHYLNYADLTVLFSLHTASITLWVSAFLVMWKNEKRRSYDLSRLLFCVIISAFFPVVGALMTYVFYVSFLIFKDQLKKSVYDDFDEYLFDVSTKEKASVSSSEAIRRAREELSFEPITDILIGKEINLKIKAIDKLSRNPKPGSVNLLKKATKDISPDVRLYASSALLKMEAQISEKIGFSESAAEKIQTAAAFADLGDLCKAYAESGFLESTLAHQYMKKASEAYRNSLDKKTDQPDVVLNYAICLMKTGQQKRAVFVLERMTALWPKNQKLAFASAQAKFNARHLAGMSELMAGLNPDELPDKLRPAVEYWKS